MSTARLSGMAFFIAVCLLLGDAPQAQPEEEPPLWTFRRFRRDFPLEVSKHLNVDTRLIHFNAVVEFTGKERVMPKDRLEKIQSLKSMTPFSRFISFYDHEVEVREGPLTFWIASSKQQAEAIAHNAPKDGGMFTATTVFLGCCFGESERIFLLKRPGPPRAKPEAQQCFTDELGGIRLGSAHQTALALLQKKYGNPVHRGEEHGVTVIVYETDAATRTLLYVRDGGPEFRDRVVSLQLSTYAGSKAKFFKDLALGDPEKRVAEVTGKVFNPTVRGEVTGLYRSDSRCSFELKQGGIYSVYIEEDPLYGQPGRPGE